jgi:hypothetical protein
MPDFALGNSMLCNATINRSLAYLRLDFEAPDSYYLSTKLISSFGYRRKSAVPILLGLLDHEVYDHVVPVGRIASHNAPVEHLDRRTDLPSRISYQSLVFVEIIFWRDTVVMDCASRLCRFHGGNKEKRSAMGKVHDDMIRHVFVG